MKDFNSVFYRRSFNINLMMKISDENVRYFDELLLKNDYLLQPFLKNVMKFGMPEILVMSVSPISWLIFAHLKRSMEILMTRK